MEYVAPLKTKRDIKRVQKALLMQGRFNPKQSAISPVGRRNLMLFDFGVYTGMKLNDILALRVSDVQKDAVLVQYAPGKFMPWHINDELRKELDDYIAFLNLKPGDWLFPSGFDYDDKHLGRSQVYRFIREAGKACRLPNIGILSIRKTFARLWFEQGLDMYFLRKYLNKPTMRDLLEYIDVDPDTDLIAKAFENFNWRQDLDDDDND